MADYCYLDYFKRRYQIWTS